MKTTIIPKTNWPGYLGAAVAQLDNGDTLIVGSEAQAELVRRAIARSRPGLKVTIEIQANYSDISD